jgi:peptidoglycan/xylan/chitin deacetylase (PgdA/CDA1 family)
LIRSLGVVRFDPLVLDYAPDSPLRDQTLTALPCSVYTRPRLGYGTDWEQMLASTRTGTDEANTQVQMMTRGDRRRRLVAITIDDGPCPMLTPLVLEVLAREHARANFFVVGEKAEQYPQLLRDIAEAGHLIGNHSYDNERLSALSAQEVAAMIDACQAVVGRLTGQAMKYLRPPGGAYTQAVLECAAVRSYVITLWTHNAGDWANPPVNEIVTRCLTGVGPGSIILMHGGDINSVRALPLIIRGLRARGLEPALLSQMHGGGTPQLLTVDAALRLPLNGWKPDPVS